MISRANKFCKFFPCHTELEDCTFCYCPFYPCCDANYGNYVYSQKQKKKIWSCQNCNWIHKKDIVDNIFRLIKKQGKFVFEATRQINTDDVGVLVLAHGSKLKKANDLLINIVSSVKKMTGIKCVVAGYLQFCEPDLSQCIKHLVEEGVKKIIIMPFFLFSGNHVTKDIPDILKTEQKKYPRIEFVYTKNLGDDSNIKEIVVNRIKEVM